MTSKKYFQKSIHDSSQHKFTSRYMYNHMDIDMDIYMYIPYQSHWPLPIDGSSADLQVHAAV